MARKLLSHPYEKGCSETWSWRTDILDAVPGNEQRISLRPYPRETIGLTIAFGDDGQQVFDGEPEISGQEAIVRNVNDLIACRGEVEIPLWHLSDSIASASWTTGTQVADLALPSGTPFFVAIGEDVLVDVGSVWRRATVTAYSQGGETLTVDFGVNTGAAAGDLSELAPLRTGLVPEPASIRFGRAAPVAGSSVTVILDRSQGRTSLDGGLFLNGSTPDGAPLLTPRGIQDGLDVQVNHGIETISGPTGFPHYVTNWTEAKLRTKFRDSFRRTQGERFRYWRSFLWSLRGSQGAFWFPTRRDDFTVLSADSDLQIITLEGRQYFDLWSETNLKAICLDDLVESIAVVQVTACELSGGNSVLGLASGWFSNPVLQCSLALPCRIDGDSISWEHDAGSSIEFGVCSIPYDFPVEDDPIDWDGLLAQIDASSAFAEFDVDFRYIELPISGELGGEVTDIVDGQGAEQTAVNGLRAMAFEDLPFDPTLGGALGVYLWADTQLAQFRIGTVPADLQFEGQGEIPRIYILPGGDPEIPPKLLGEARYIKSWDEVPTAIGPSRATAPVRFEDGYRLEFADATYFAPFWTPRAFGLNDQSGNENHLVTVESSEEAYRDDADSRYRVAGALTCASLSGGPPPIATMAAMVGRIDSAPGGDVELLTIGSSTDMVVYRDSAGGVYLNRGSDSSEIGTLANGDWFLLLAIFNGASSQIHLLKNDDTTWTSGTVDDGGGSMTSPTSLLTGWPHVHAVLLGAAPDDVLSYREGLARYYEFQSLVSQTGMQATTADVDGWKVLHDGTTDYVLSVVLEIEEPGPATIKLFEVLNDAENGGMRWEWTKATSELTVTFIGTAGTFAETFDLSAFVGRMVVELRFDSAASGSAELFANGDSQGSFSPSSFSYSTVQQNALLIGTDRGWTLCELRLTEGADLNTDELTEKWGIAIFDPLSVPGESATLLAGWEAGFAGNTFGGSPEEFSELVDMSGSGNDLTQSGVLDLPRRTASWRAGRPALTGTSGTLRTLTATGLTQGSPGASGQTLVAVFDYTAIGDIQHIFAVQNASELLRIGVDQFENWNFGPGGAVGGAGTFVVVCRFGSSGRCIIHRDGDDPVVTTGSYAALGTSVTAIGVMNRPGNSAYSRGNAGVFQFWSSDMSDADMDYLAAGFAARYAIASA